MATTALRLLAHWAFEEARLPRLELVTDPENAASQKVAERAAFRQEGVLRSYIERRGQRQDCIIFSLLPGDLEDGDRG